MPRRQLSPAATIVAFLLISLVTPALFLFLSSTAERVRAQELEPKQAFVPPPEPSETSTNRGPTARRTPRGKAIASLPKPSGKMGFVPNAASPRGTPSSAAARTSANSVVRRQAAEQPPKVATRQPKSSVGPRSKAMRVLPPPVPVVAEEPIQVARSRDVQIVEPEATPESVAEAEMEPKSEPEAEVASQAEPPVEFSERPELPIQEIELPIVRRTERAGPMLDDDVAGDEEAPPVRSARDLVEFEFEVNDSAADKDESMELVEIEEPSQKRQQSDVEPAWDREIQSVAAQEEKPEENPVTNAVAGIEDEVAPPKDDVLAELIHNPVRSIEIRKAVQLPPVAEKENQKLREPADQARAYLQKRPPFKFWPVYRDPWVANRDSYAFHHNPLWFEDPNLERCGRGWGHLTSVKSFACFSVNVPILPYRMTAQPSCSCVRTLPDCTVCEKFGYDAYLPPWSWKAATVQAASVVGFIYVIP